MKWNGYLVSSALLLLMACSEQPGINQESSQDQSPQDTHALEFQYDIQALFQQSLISQRSSRALNDTPFESEQIMLGTLSITSAAGGDAQLFSWTVYLDQNSWQAQSNISIELTPGQYDFYLLLEDDNHQYVATSTHTVIDGENNIAMSISPVMGGVLLQAQIDDAQSLAKYRFQYDVNELVQISNPKVGITIDDQPQQIFTINKDSGMPEGYLSLTPGQHSIILALFDDNVQIARSVEAQQNINLENGQNVIMDLVPLHAETQLVLSAQGGDASINIHIPQLIIDEVGGIENLRVTFTAVGEHNPVQQVRPQFDAVDDGYLAQLELSNLQYDEMTISMIFEDSNSGEQIASCNSMWSINALSQTMNCNMQVLRRRIFSGGLLAVLGINVLNDLHEPMAGAVIKDQDGNILGITGSNEWGSMGYLKTYLKAGDYTIVADHIASNKSTSTQLSLQSLAVENIILTLDSPYNFPQGAHAQGKITTAFSHSCVIEGEGVRCWGSNHFGQTNSPALNNPSKVWSSDVSSCAKTDEGVVCWGSARSNYGQVPDELTAVTKLSFGSQASCAINENKPVCWGNNSFKQLNIPQDLEYALDIAVASRHVCAITDAGLVRCWGNNHFGQLDIPDDLQNVRAIYTGGYDSCAVSDSGVHCWGANAHDQNDFNANIENFTTLAMGILNTCVVQEGVTQCFGYEGNEINDVPEDLGQVSSLSVSSGYACAITQNGVRCWGTDNYGEPSP